MNEYPGHYLVYVHTAIEVDEDPALFKTLGEAEDFATSVYSSSAYIENKNDNGPGYEVEIAWECDIEDPRCNTEGFVKWKRLGSIVNGKFTTVY